MSYNAKTYISELKNNVVKQVTLCGWLYNSRASGKIQFLIIRDGTGLCQCIVEKGKVSDELFEELKHLGQESSLAVTGLARADERSAGGYELAVTDAKIIAPATDYPITPKSHGIDFLLRHRHLHLRSQGQWCIGKIRHTVIDAIRRFFNDNGFTLVDTPILTAAAGEEQQSLFEVDYFGEPLYLTQTGQLHLESAAMSYGKVYCFGPTFRAERSKTRIHLTELIRQKIAAQYNQARSQQIYSRCKQKVKLPFGHIKRNLGVGIFLLRGLAGVRAEMSVMCSCFNIASLIGLFGVSYLIRRFMVFG